MIIIWWLWNVSSTGYCYFSFSKNSLVTGINITHELSAFLGLCLVYALNSVTTHQVGLSSLGLTLSLGFCLDSVNSCNKILVLRTSSDLVLSWETWYCKTINPDLALSWSCLGLVLVLSWSCLGLVLVLSWFSGKRNYY